MKLSDIAVDAGRIEQGEWVENIPEMGDLRLKVRGIGNADWRRLMSKLIDAVPRNKRMGGRVDPDTMDAITTQLLSSACLIDWANLDVPYSKQKASELLADPQYRALRDAVMWAASQVGQAIEEKKDDQAGNSASASAGT
jgi:hypothetical protein